MADAFRGLTIRLGADARPLNQAINAVTKSAGLAQQQMNRLNKALKFNPANTKAMAAMVDLAGDKAMHSARQVQTLQNALRQAAAESKRLLKGSSYEGSDLSRMASDTREAYAATQKLRAESQHVSAELGHIYDAAKRVFAKQNGLNWNDSSAEVNKLRKEFSRLQGNLDKTGKAGTEAREKIYGLIKLAGAGGAKNIGDMFGLEKSEAGGAKLLEIFKSLRQQSRQLNADLTAMEKVEGFRAIQNGMIAAKSELREAAAEAARLKSELYALGGPSSGIASAVANARRLDGAMEESVRAAEELKAAAKALPTDMGIARTKAHALADAEDTIRQKLQAVEKVIKSIESSPGFDKVRAMTRNAWVEAEKAEQKYAKMAEGMSKLEAKAQSAEAELKEINSLTLGKPRNSVKELATAFELLRGEKVEKPIEELNKLENEAKEARAAMDKLRTAMNGVENEMKDASAAKTLAKSRTEAAKLRGELAKIDFQKSFLSKLGGIGQSFRQFGYGMYSTLTPAIMMAGRYAINAADQIDSSYRDMRKTVNGTEEQFEHLKDAAIEFSRTHVTSADQILDIEAIGGQLGISANDLESFATTVSNLDIATNMDTEDIALSLAKLSNIMHFGQEQYDSFADSLVRLGNNEPALESDIMKISTRFAGMAANVGMGTADMLAFATAATATGQKAEAAGSSMQRTIGRIEKAVATGGKGLKAYAKVSGMSADEFKTTWKDVDNHGPAKVMQAFIEGLHGINESGGSVTSTLSDLGITGVRDIQLLEGLSNTTDVLSESMKMANDAWNGTSTTMNDGSIEQAGDAAREAQRKSEGFSGELAKMKNNAAALAVELGEGAAPWIKSIGGALTDLTGMMREMPDDAKEKLVGFAAGLAALGPASVGIGTTMSAIGNIKGMFNAIGGKFTDWGAKLAKADFIGPLTKSQQAMRGFSKALGSVGAFFGSTGGMLAIAAAIPILTAFADKIQENAEKAEAFRKATSGLKETADKIKETSHAAADGFEGEAAAIGNVTYSLGDHTAAAEKLIGEGAQLYDSINGQITDALSNAMLVQAYADKIESLAGNCHGSAGKLEELRAAVEKYNELTGDSVGITDNFTGSLNTSTDELNANTEAFQLNAMAKAYGNVYEEALQHQAKIESQMKVYDATIQDATKSLEDMGLTYQDAMTVFNKDDGWYAIMQAHPEVMDISKQIADAENAKKTLAEPFEEAQRASEAARTAYIEQTNAAREATLQQQEAAKKARDASTYYEALGENGKAAFNKIRNEAGFAGNENQKFATALHDAGINATLLGQVGTNAFSGFLTQAQKLSSDVPTQLGYVVQAMNAANNFNFSPKEIEVTDNGSIVRWEGHALNLNNMTLDDKQFEVTANGLEFTNQQTATLEGSLGRLEQQHPEIMLSANVDNSVDKASADVDELVSKDGKTTTVTATATGNATDGSAKQAVEDTKASIDSMKGKTVNARANVSGKGDVDSLKWSIDSLQDKSVTIRSKFITERITINTTKSGHAAGAIFNGRGGIPLNASGAINGIVNRAMLTNIGWVGEAGAEAVMHMKNAGGAVIPLSNRRYVRPFARAVAREMGGSSQTVVNNNYTIDGVSFAEGSDGAKALQALATALKVGGRS